MFRAIQIREGKVMAGEAHLDRLPAHMLARSCSLPRLVGPTFGADQIDMLAEHVGGCAELAS